MSVVGVFFLLVISLARLAYADDDTIVRRYDVSQDGSTFKLIALNDLARVHHRKGIRGRCTRAREHERTPIVKLCGVFLSGVLSLASHQFR